MNITHAYMLQGSYGTGGMTVAMLRRCKEFAKHGIKCISLTIDFTENLYQAISLKEHYDCDGVLFKNPFVELSDKADQWLASVNQDIAHHYLLTYLDKNANEVVYYHTNGSQYGTTPYFETCITNKKFSNSEGGQKLIACTYVLKARKQKIELTFSLQGLCTTISIQNSETNEWEGFLVFDYDTGVITDYGNSYNFRCIWLNNIISSTPNAEKSAVVICDGPGSAQKMKWIKKVYKKIIMLHTHHIDYRTNKLYDRDAWNVKNNEFFDDFIVLTPQQKKDLLKYSQKDNFVVIPHFIDFEDNPISNSDSYNDMRIGLFSRLYDSKGVKDAIEMMSILHEMGVKAHLEIFGSLPLKKDYENALKKYKHLIETLNLQDYVHLRGQTNQVAMEMSQCCVGIMPSYSESFSLVVAEFMFCGVPVVSYDCEYGPASMIEHGKNSFLVKVGDQKAMAKYVAKLIKDKALRKEMSQTAKTSITQLLDKEHIYGLWEKVLNAPKKV